MMSHGKDVERGAAGATVIQAALVQPSVVEGVPVDGGPARDENSWSEGEENRVDGLTLSPPGRPIPFRVLFRVLFTDYIGFIIVWTTARASARGAAARRRPRSRCGSRCSSAASCRCGFSSTSRSWGWRPARSLW